MSAKHQSVPKYHHDCLEPKSPSFAVREIWVPILALPRPAGWTWEGHFISLKLDFFNIKWAPQYIGGICVCWEPWHPDLDAIPGCGWLNQGQVEQDSHFCWSQCSVCGHAVQLTCSFFSPVILPIAQFSFREKKENMSTLNTQFSLGPRMEGLLPTQDRSWPCSLFLLRGPAYGHFVEWSLSSTCRLPLWTWPGRGRTCLKAKAQLASSSLGNCDRGWGTGIPLCLRPVGGCLGLDGQNRSLPPVPGISILFELIFDTWVLLWGLSGPAFCITAVTRFFIEILWAQFPFHEASMCRDNGIWIASYMHLKLHLTWTLSHQVCLLKDHSWQISYGAFHTYFLKKILTNSLGSGLYFLHYRDVKTRAQERG